MSLIVLGRRLASLAVAMLAGLTAAPGATLPFTVRPGQGVFLHLSDIHFDPLAQPALLPQLLAAPVERWSDIFKAAPQPQPYSRYGQDTNYPLLMATLTAAQGIRYDYILNTGDDLAHDFKKTFLDAGGTQQDYDGFTIKTMRFIDRVLTESFPDAPLVLALGNNDAECGDYMLAPHSAMLTALAQDLPVVAADPDAVRDFSTGGFYVVPHPTVAGHDIIVLSDVFWSRDYRGACDRQGGDIGGAEFAWLEWTLYREKLAGRTASLAMHIPPGIDAFSSAHHGCPAGIRSFWHDADTRRFLDLVGRYKDVLRGSYAGHTHMDDFRVLADATGAPVLATRIAPAVSPIFNNDPAFTVLLFDRSTAAVSDYATFHLANLGEAGTGTPPDWRLEYTFDQAYGAQSYGPPTLAALAGRIRRDPAVRAAFLGRYAAETKARGPVTEQNWNAFACAQTAITASDYAACLCPSGMVP